MHLTLVISLLRRGAALDQASSLLTLLGLSVALAPLFGLAVNSWLTLAGLLMLLLGIVEKYWAQRVALDADLFSALVDTKDIEQALSELDTALQQLGLAPVDNNPALSPSVLKRGLLSRNQGAIRLLRWQIISLSGQVILVLVASAAGCWLAFYY